MVATLNMFEDGSPLSLALKPHAPPDIKLPNCGIFFKTIVSCRELWLWGETVGTWVAALKMAVNGVFEDFYVLLYYNTLGVFSTRAREGGVIVWAYETEHLSC